MGSNSLLFSTSLKRIISAYLVFSLSFTGFLSILLIISPTVSAATYVGGDIDEDTTWDDDGSPYVVTSDIHVLEDVILKIDPGVTVKFNNDKKIVVDGLFYANGTANDKITFTSNNSSPQKGDWYTIRLRTEGNNIEHSNIEYASYGVFMTYYGTNNTVTNTTITDSEIDGIYITNSDGNNLKDITVKDSDRYGITVYQSENTIIENALITGNNYFGINLNSSKYTTISNSNISDNEGIGILFYSKSNHTTIDNCTLLSNEKEGLHLSGSGYNFVNNTLVQSSGTSGTYSGINMGGSTSQENNFYNVTVKSSTGHGIDLMGSKNNTFNQVVSQENTKSGIYSESQVYNLKLLNSDISHNDDKGLYFYDRLTASRIEDTIVTYNGEDGIFVEVNTDACDSGCDDDDLITNNVFENLTITHNSDFGIYMHTTEDRGHYMKNNKVLNSTVSFNSKTGIHMLGDECCNNHVDSNEISYNEISNNSGHGIWLRGHYHGYVKNNIIKQNTIYYNTGNGIKIDASDQGGKADNNQIISNVIKNNGASGIYLTAGTESWVKNTIIDGNTISGHDYGIYFYASSTDYRTKINDNTVRNSTISGNQIGIYLDKKQNSNGNAQNQCNGNKFDNLTVINNFQYGFYLNECEDNEITNSIISNNGPQGDTSVAIPVAQINSISSHDVVHGTNVTFNGTTTLSDATAFRWNSSIDGTIGNEKLLTISSDNLSAGHHTIYFYVKDSQGSWTSPAISYVKVSYKVKIDNIEETTHQYNTNISNYDFYGIWNFDEGEGSTAYDLSGNAKHGSLEGDDDISWTDGKFDNAILFDYSLDRIPYVIMPELIEDDGLHNFTAQLWFYVDSLPSSNNEGYLMEDNIDSNFYLRIKPDGEGEAELQSYIRLRFNEYVYSYSLGSNMGTIEEGQWYHAAIYISDEEDTAKLYLDGEIVATAVNCVWDLVHQGITHISLKGK